MPPVAEGLRRFGRDEESAMNPLTWSGGDPIKKILAEALRDPAEHAGSPLPDRIVGRSPDWRTPMKACEGQIGRVFVIRLEDGDEMPVCVERFAAEKRVRAGFAIFVGGVGDGELVVGPRRSTERPPQPMTLPLTEAHEVLGAGVLAPKEDGTPVLHMHASLGRMGTSLTGCIRPGVKTWLVGEVILYEVVGVDVARVADQATGFSLLEPRGSAPVASGSVARPAPAAEKKAAPEPATQADEAVADDDGPSSEVLFLFNTELN